VKIQSEVEELEEELSERISQVARRFIDAWSETDRGYGYPGLSANFSLDSISPTVVYITWKETWNYGGRDGGSFMFPTRYLWDEKELTEYEEKRAAEKAAEVAKIDEEELKKKEAEYERLKKELGK
jgi:hypothetical protein